MEKMNNGDDVITVLEDNPCWGSPTRHLLKDLLSLVDRNGCIVYDSPQYLVLNKPPDLRMDGPYSATVHKLLTYWYPPSSLSSFGKYKQKLNESTESDDKAETNICDKISCYDKLLLEAVSRLHQYNDAHDNYLRPCHQLDYATSGILLVAKTQKAAAHISRLFEERHEGVQKSYVAVVVGDLRKGLLCESKEYESKKSNKISPKVPIWTEGNTTRDLREQLHRLEETYRRSRAASGKQYRRVRDASKNKEKNEETPSFTGCTFQGFQPAHSIFAKWKSKLKMISEKKDSSSTMIHEYSTLKKHHKRRKVKSQSASALLTDDNWQQIWNPVNEVVGASTVTPAPPTVDFLKLEWKQLQKEHPALKQAIVRATDIHNDILRDAIRDRERKKQEEDRTNVGNELPFLFRLSKYSNIPDNGSNNKHSVNNSGIAESTFYVCCPLAQRPDQFNMVVPSSMARTYPHLQELPVLSTSFDKDCDTSKDTARDLKFRPSLTKCTILERGTLSIMRDNAEVKVDVTKIRLFPMTGRRHQLRVHMALTGFPILGDASYGGDSYIGIKKCQINEKDNDVMAARSRMFLHAQFLQLPTLLGESEPDWKIALPDPFVNGCDGKLKWN